MTANDLTANEAVILITLMALPAEVKNVELKKYGPELGKLSREKLIGLGFLESTKVGRSFVHTLTARGVHQCWQMVDSGPPIKLTGPHATVFTVLAAINGQSPMTQKSFEAFFGKSSRAERTLESRIRDAYQRLASRPGARISLAQLRVDLSDISKTDLDGALYDLQRSEDVSLIPQENRRLLTSEDHEAAVVVGNQKNHLLLIEAN